MSELSTGLQNLQASLADALQSFASYLPYLGAALLLLLVGWLVAKILRAGTVKLGAGFNVVLGHFGRWTSGGRPLQLSAVVLKLIGNVVFWLVILLFTALAARVARLELFTIWLDRIVAYLPTLVAGGLILLAGLLVSALARDVVTTALETAKSGQSELYGRLVQGAIFLAALVVGLDQIGIDVTFLIILFSLIVGGLLLSLALAFGFGARDFVGNLIGANQARHVVQPGQVMRVGNLEGQVLELTTTSVIIATDTGRVSVPARHFQQDAVLIMATDDDE